MTVAGETSTNVSHTVNEMRMSCQMKLGSTTREECNHHAMGQSVGLPEKIDLNSCACLGLQDSGSTADKTGDASGHQGCYCPYDSHFSWQPWLEQDGHSTESATSISTTCTSNPWLDHQSFLNAGMQLPACHDNLLADIPVSVKIFEAIMSQDDVKLKQLLDENDVELESLNTAQLTPLTASVLCANPQNQTESVSIVKTLLHNGCSPDTREKRTPLQLTPLWIACQKALLPIVEVLLLHGASANLADLLHQETPLQLTLRMLAETDDPRATSKLVEQAQLLLSHGDIDVVKSSAADKSSLELALMTSHEQIIKSVISRGHSRFHPGVVRRALDALNSPRARRLSEDSKECLRGLLVAELEPGSLEHLCIRVITATMRRRLSQVSRLPCPSSVKEKIREQGRSERRQHRKSVDELQQEKMAHDFLRFF